MKNRLSQTKGFTLIEILIVIGILAVLFAIVLVALNPARQFAQANDTKRSSDVNAMLNAIHQYGADHRGVIPAGINTTATEIASTGSNICTDLVTTYIAALPSDPLTNNGTPVTVCGEAYNTNYWVYRSAADNRITVFAPATQILPTIMVTR